jgi:hypothetical protein
VTPGAAGDTGVLPAGPCPDARRPFRYWVPGASPWGVGRLFAARQRDVGASVTGRFTHIDGAGCGRWCGGPAAGGPDCVLRRCLRCPRALAGTAVRAAPARPAAAVLLARWRARAGPVPVGAGWSRPDARRPFRYWVPGASPWGVGRLFAARQRNVGGSVTGRFTHNVRVAAAPLGSALVVSEFEVPVTAVTGLPVVPDRMPGALPGGVVSGRAPGAGEVSCEAPNRSAQRSQPRPPATPLAAHPDDQRAAHNAGHQQAANNPTALPARQQPTASRGAAAHRHQSDTPHPTAGTAPPRAAPRTQPDRPTTRHPIGVTRKEPRTHPKARGTHDRKGGLASRQPVSTAGAVLVWRRSRRCPSWPSARYPAVDGPGGEQPVQGGAWGHWWHLGSRPGGVRAACGGACRSAASWRVAGHGAGRRGGVHTGLAVT